VSQGDPFEVMAAVFATLDLVSAATKAVDHARELGLPRPAQAAAIVANVGFVDAWERRTAARPGPADHRDAGAVEAGVSAEDLAPNSNAASLLDLTLGERAKNPATQIVADYPLAQPAGSAGIYAIGLMCGSTEPEEAKRAAYALLALLTAHAG